MQIESTETRMFKQLDPEKRRRITESAIGEFAEKGYERASMNVVVEKAGISKGALFKYFQSKSGLFAFVYRIALGRVKDYLRRVRDGSREAPFFDRLERIMRAGVDFIHQHPGLARIYYHIIFTGDSPYKGEILGELHRESLRFIENLVKEGIERGDLRADLNPRMTAFVLECVLDRFLQAQHIRFLDHSLMLYGASEEEMNAWVREIIGLFKSGMAVFSGREEEK